MASGSPKTSFLQIRVSPDQKRALQEQARRARLDVSALVLARTLPSLAFRFSGLASRLAHADQRAFALAELHDFLAQLTSVEFPIACADSPFLPSARGLVPNYVAAMVEHAALQKGARVPRWTREVPPHPEPWFASDLMSLRLHLLVSSPPAFRSRNLFVDSTVGDRV